MRVGGGTKKVWESNHENKLCGFPDNLPNVFGVK